MSRSLSNPWMDVMHLRPFLCCTRMCTFDPPSAPVPEKASPPALKFSISPAGTFNRLFVLVHNGFTKHADGQTCGTTKNYQF